MKLHTGDTVIVITGKDKGKTGTVLRVLPLEDRVVVEGLNIRTKHMKKNVEQAGRIVKYEASLAACKVMIVDPKTGKPSRIGYQFKDGKKIRISKLSGEVVKKGKMPAKKKVEKVEKSEKGEKVSKTKETTAETSKPGAKKPFWQKMKFGAAVEGDTGDTTRSSSDHTVPAQQSITHRSGGRGS
jgi:large subunit ribosomal protein L24